MEKPRITYAQYQAMQQPKKLTVEQVISRFVAEMGRQKGNLPGVRPLGESHYCNLKRIAREPFGQLVAAEVTKAEVIAFARELRQRVKPSTVNAYVGFIGGVFDYAGGAWKDCDSLSKAPMTAARAFLMKNEIIGKSSPRDRRPTDEEIAAILAAAEARNARPKTRIDLVKLERWQKASSRRLSESCRMKWCDWNRDDHTLTVYGMKDPRRKGKIKVVALTDEAQAMLIELEPKRLRPDDPNEPVFGWVSKDGTVRQYNPHSASQASRDVKKKLGIKGLRLHDSRRDCGSRLVEAGFTSAEAIGFTGHETTNIFEKNYMRMDVSVLKNGPASKRNAGVR